jgi:lipooligosaccharide transport system ATP-binding protein
MDEAQRLCDHIVIIDHGQILAEGSPAELIRKHVSGNVIEVRKPLPKALANGRFDREDIGDSVLFYVEEPKALQDQLSGKTVYMHRTANLEDVFLRLTGRQLRE